MAAPRLLEGYLFSSTGVRFWRSFASPCRNRIVVVAWKLRKAFGSKFLSILALMIFLFENFFQKVLQSQNRRFCAWASGSGFGAPICVAVVCNSFVFRNSVSADRSGMMAASRFLAAAAAWVIIYYCVLREGGLAQAGLRWRHCGSLAERSREEERTAVLPSFATPRCIPVARTAVLLAYPCSFRLSGMPDSKTRAAAAVLLTSALDRWLLVTSRLFARVEKKLRPKRAWTLDPQATVNSPDWMIAHDTKTITQSNVETMIKSKGNSPGLNKKVCNCVTSTGLRKIGQVELRWDESTRVERSWEEKREIKRELRRVKKMCTEMKVVEKSWREVRSRWKSWKVVSQRQEVRSPGKEHGNLPQIL